MTKSRINIAKEIEYIKQKESKNMMILKNKLIDKSIEVIEAKSNVLLMKKLKELSEIINSLEKNFHGTNDKLVGLQIKKNISSTNSYYEQTSDDLNRIDEIEKNKIDILEQDNKDENRKQDYSCKSGKTKYQEYKFSRLEDFDKFMEVEEKKKNKSTKFVNEIETKQESRNSDHIIDEVHSKKGVNLDKIQDRSKFSLYKNKLFTCYLTSDVNRTIKKDDLVYHDFYGYGIVELVYKNEIEVRFYRNFLKVKMFNLQKSLKIMNKNRIIKDGYKL